MVEVRWTGSVDAGTVAVLVNSVLCAGLMPSVVLSGILKMVDGHSVAFEG